MRTRRRQASVVMLAATLMLAPVATTSAASVHPDPASATVGGARVLALRAGLARATTGSARVAERDGSGVLTFAGGSSDEPLQRATGEDSSKAARRFVNEYAPAFGVAAPATDLSEDRSFHSSSGDAVRYQQRYRGVPVIGGELAVQLAPSGAVVSTSGKAAVGLTVGVTPEVSKAAAVAAARAITAEHDSVDPATLVVDPPELSIYDPSLWGTADPAGQRLVWRTSAHTAIGGVNRYVLVDATTGAVALDFTQVEAALHRDVCDRGSVAGSPPPCTAPVRSDTATPTNNPDVDSAYDLAGLTYNFYFNLFGRDSVDGAGLRLKSTVNVCIPSCPYQNAFWDGSTNQMYYGPGFAAADDVVGHELTHGVTQYTSKLAYYGQAGAINESISDVFGELIDRSTPDLGTPWALGEDLPGHPSGIRNMQNPPLFGDPDRVGSPLYTLASSDNAGVHTNSGVNNKAAYLIDNGDIFNGQTIVGLGDAKTAWIYYIAQTTMLSSLSQYSDLAVILPQACTNLVGQHGIVANDCVQVSKAVLATEMKSQPTAAAGLAEPAACITPGLVKNSLLMSDRQNLTTEWLLSPSAPASQAPKIQLGVTTADQSIVFPDPSAAVTMTATRKDPITIPAGETYLSFRHLVSLEPTFDGGVVDYSTDNGVTWHDVAALPGQGTGNNGYDGVAAAVGSSAFTTDIPVFRTTRFNLSALAGSPVRLRFREVTDVGGSASGWFVSSPTVYTCGASGTAPPVQPPPPPAPPPFASLVPARLMETRTGLNTVDGQYNGIGLRPAGSVTALTVVSRGGVPADASSVNLNVTVTEAQGDGFLTVYPCGIDRPVASNLNYVAGSTIANMVTVGVGVGGQVCIYAHATTQVVVDVGGYFPAGAALTTLVPARLVESRPNLTTVDGLQNGIGVRPAGSVTVVQVAGRAGIPADAAAVMLNVTVTETQAEGFVTVFGCGGPVPTASNLNYLAGMTIPNAVVAKLGTGGTVCVYTQSPTQLVVDVGGWFPAVSDLVPLDVPARLMESRPGLTTVDGLFNGFGLRGAGQITQLQVTGRGGVPANATAVALNVTVTDTQAPGFVTVFPCGNSLPTASNLNYGIGTIIPNAVIAKIGVGGTVCFYTHTPTQILADVGGYFTG